MQIKSLRTERVSVSQAVKDFKDCMKEGVRYNMWHLANGSLREVTYPDSHGNQIWIENGVAFYDSGVVENNTYVGERTEKRRLAEVK